MGNLYYNPEKWIGLSATCDKLSIERLKLYWSLYQDGVKLILQGGSDVIKNLLQPNEFDVADFWILPCMVFALIFFAIFVKKMYRSASATTIYNINKQNMETYIYIYFAFLSVRLYPINVKTAEPIGPKLCVVPHVTQGNPRLFFIKSVKFFVCFCLQCIQRENVHNWNRKA